MVRMDNERLPKRVMYGELEGGKGLLGRSTTELDGFSQTRYIAV